MNPSERTQWLSADDRTLLDTCDFHTYRASGPGGQKRNKTDSAVRLRHRPTELTVVATESRSQHENRARALRRLRLRIALTVRERPDAWPDHLGDYIGPDGRLRVSPRNDDYVHVVARILDALHAYGGRLGDTARAVGTTTAQLTRFLTADGKLHDAANQLRTLHDRRPLRSAAT
jgi:hypothetical protein